MGSPAELAYQGIQSQPSAAVTDPSFGTMMNYPARQSQYPLPHPQEQLYQAHARTVPPFLSSHSFQHAEDTQTFPSIPPNHSVHPQQSITHAAELSSRQLAQASVPPKPLPPSDSYGPADTAAPTHSSGYHEHEIAAAHDSGTYDFPTFDYGDEEDDEERIAEQKRRRLEDERRVNLESTCQNSDPGNLNPPQTQSALSSHTASAVPTR